MRHVMRFLLGDELQEITHIDPAMTVLDWLRQRRRVGTKEGCNEGDCGACTVVVAHLENGRLRYRAVNSCIQFVGSLDGCQLLTVEDLKRNGCLHAIQQAIIDCHGSQCGFCTPGFVMSLFALTRENPEPPSDEHIDDVLAGNLCRCTGYASIIRAARRAYDIGFADDDAVTVQIKERLASLIDDRTFRVAEGERAFFAPVDRQTLADLLLTYPLATLVAGATDVGLWVTKGMQRPSLIVWTGRVKELQEISETADSVELGAAVTYAQAVAELSRYYSDIGEIFRRLGSMQIRNVGTIGGNIGNGSPIGDASPALIAAGAALHLRRGQTCRSMPLEEFFRAYGQQDRQESEFIERITVPKPTAGWCYRAYKISKRFDQDISAVMAAFKLHLSGTNIRDVRIAFGGMAAIPKRAVHTEAVLRGKEWNETAVVEAQSAIERDFAPISDMRASAGYRLSVAKNLIRRLYAETSGLTVETRLVGQRSPSHV
jgi:xanthine dehydrogenase small subunit